jgi:hypothetical protein
MFKCRNGKKSERNVLVPYSNPGTGTRIIVEQTLNVILFVEVK